MKIVVSQELLAYMRQKQKTHICVEVATSNTSDIEVSEIFLRLANVSFASYLKEKKKYREVEAGDVKVLLPPYHLEYDEQIAFDRKKRFLFHTLTYSGIHL